MYKQKLLPTYFNIAKLTLVLWNLKFLITCHYNSRDIFMTVQKSHDSCHIFKTIIQV